MKTLATATVLTLLAATAGAATIADIQQGVYPEGANVTVNDAVVTGISETGAFIAELPNGPWAGIWVYIGEAHTMTVGDVVDVTGLYEEYFDFSEINVEAAGLDGSYEVVGQTDAPEPWMVTANDYLSDPEPYESVSICIMDGMRVIEAPNEFGEWTAEVIGLDQTIIFDDMFYDDTTVEVGQCYEQICGIIKFSFGNYLFEAFADGLTIVDCSVPVTSRSLTEVKALYD